MLQSLLEIQRECTVEDMLVRPRKVVCWICCYMDIGISGYGAMEYRAMGYRAMGYGDMRFHRRLLYKYLD